MGTQASLQKEEQQYRVNKEIQKMAQRSPDMSMEEVRRIVMEEEARREKRRQEEEARKKAKEQTVVAEESGGVETGGAETSDAPTVDVSTDVSTGDAPADVPADVPVGEIAGATADTTPADVSASVSGGINVEASESTPVDVPASATADVTTEIPAVAPAADVPTGITADVPIDVPTTTTTVDVPTDLPAGTPAEPQAQVTVNVHTDTELPPANPPEGVSDIPAAIPADIPAVTGTTTITTTKTVPQKVPSIRTLTAGATPTKASSVQPPPIPVSPPSELKKTVPAATPTPQVLLPARAPPTVASARTLSRLHKSSRLLLRTRPPTPPAPTPQPVAARNTTPLDVITTQQHFRALQAFLFPMHARFYSHRSASVSPSLPTTARVASPHDMQTQLQDTLLHLHTWSQHAQRDPNRFQCFYEGYAAPLLALRLAYLYTNDPVQYDSLQHLEYTRDLKSSYHARLFPADTRERMQCLTAHHFTLLRTAIEAARDDDALLWYNPYEDKYASLTEAQWDYSLQWITTLPSTHANCVTLYFQPGFHALSHVSSYLIRRTAISRVQCLSEWPREVRLRARDELVLRLSPANLEHLSEEPADEEEAASDPAPARLTLLCGRDLENLLSEEINATPEAKTTYVPRSVRSWTRQHAEYARESASEKSTAADGDVEPHAQEQAHLFRLLEGVTDFSLYGPGASSLARHLPPLPYLTRFVCEGLSPADPLLDPSLTGPVQELPRDNLCCMTAIAVLHDSALAEFLVRVYGRAGRYQQNPGLQEVYVVHCRVPAGVWRDHLDWSRIRRLSLVQMLHDSQEAGETTTARKALPLERLKDTCETLTLDVEYLPETLSLASFRVLRKFCMANVQKELDVQRLQKALPDVLMCIEVRCAPGVYLEASTVCTYLNLISPVHFKDWRVEYTRYHQGQAFRMGFRRRALQESFGWCGGVTIALHKQGPPV